MVWVNFGSQSLIPTYPPSYCRSTNNNLQQLLQVIAKQKTWSESRKWQVSKAYSLFAKFNGLNWIPPKYKPVKKLPIYSRRGRA